MTTYKTKYLDQNKLKVLSDNLVDDIENVLDHFSIKYYKTAKKYYGGCPIHQGGEDNAPWNLFYEGDYYKGNWKCRSHHCELIFKKSIIGLIRGLLSREKGWRKEGDKEVSFNETVEWILKWQKVNFSDIKSDEVLAEKSSFVTQSKIWTPKPTHELKLTPDIVVKTLKIPSSYFVKRGYDTRILERYMVGDCTNPAKEMFNRAVVPIFDDDNVYVIGVTGRSIFEKCPICLTYHNPTAKCEKDYRNSKWRHNEGFLAENHLYNFGIARNYVNAVHSITLVESPGNVWKLVENGINNVCATFGSNLTDAQLSLLMKTETLILNLIYDNDEAGEIAVKNIRDKAGKIYNINIVKFDKHNDISEMTNQEIEQIIKPQLIGYTL